MNAFVLLLLIASNIVIPKFLVIEIVDARLEQECGGGDWWSGASQQSDHSLVRR